MPPVRARSRLPRKVAVRLCVLSGIASLTGLLMASGLKPVPAVAVSLMTSAGAVEIACRLTSPFRPWWIQTCVVLVILVYVVILRAAYPPWIAVAIGLGATAIATEITRRLTGQRYWPLTPVS
jgi:hypothetical protein